MAENGPDLSAELARSGVKLRDLAEKPELKSGLLAEIVGKLTGAQAEGVATIEGASTKDKLLASLPKLVENVKASPSHIDKQIAQMVGKLVDKDKYPDEEASAKALLEKGIAASERGYLGYVARQKYKTVAASLGWSKGEDQGTAKVFIDNYLGEKPTNSDEVRQNLTTFDLNSSLEVALSGTHSAQSFMEMMKNQWKIKPEETNSPEVDSADLPSQIEHDFLANHVFPNTDAIDAETFNKQFLASANSLRGILLAEVKSRLNPSQETVQQIRTLPNLKKFNYVDARALKNWVKGKPITGMSEHATILGGAMRELCGLKLLLAEQGIPEEQIIPNINQALFPRWEDNPTMPKPADFNTESPFFGWDYLDLENATSGTLLRKLYDAESTKHFKPET